MKKTISHAHDIDDTHVFGFTQTLDHVHEHVGATNLIERNPRKLPRSWHLFYGEVQIVLA